MSSLRDLVTSYLAARFAYCGGIGPFDMRRAAREVRELMDKSGLTFEESIDVVSDRIAQWDPDEQPDEETWYSPDEVLRRLRQSEGCDEGRL